MKRIFIAYATREGHTATIAERTAQRLTGQGHSVTLINVASIDPFEEGPEYFDAGIIAASIHTGTHEREMVAFVKKHRGALCAVPTAFLSVSLSETTAENPGASQEDREKAKRDVAAMIEQFCADTGWYPYEAKPVAGALAYSKYNFVVRFVMKRIARAAGGSTDTSRDHVYTDWDDLHRFIDGFVADLEDGEGAQASIDNQRPAAAAMAAKKGVGHADRP